MPELDEKEITGPDRGENDVETPFVDEALRTAPVHRMVGDGQLLPQKERKGHAPAGLGRGVGVFLGGGGITGDIERALPGPRLRGGGGSGPRRRDGEGNGGKRRGGDLSAGE